MRKSHQNSTIDAHADVLTLCPAHSGHKRHRPGGYRPTYGPHTSTSWAYTPTHLKHLGVTLDGIAPSDVVLETVVEPEPGHWEKGGPGAEEVVVRKESP